MNITVFLLNDNNKNGEYKIQDDQCHNSARMVDEVYVCSSGI